MGLKMKIFLYVMICIGISATSLHTAENYGNVINKKLLYDIARVESNHNDKAVSNKGAIGRYQIRYSVWHKELKENNIIKSKKDLFNREKNEQAAVYILVKYYKQTKSLKKTLIKYSGGDKNYFKRVLNGEKIKSITPPLRKGHVNALVDKGA
jgi:soluble lytic murein transglycosylase-like protein